MFCILAWPESFDEGMDFISIAPIPMCTVSLCAEDGCLSIFIPDMGALLVFADLAVLADFAGIGIDILVDFFLATGFALVADFAVVRCLAFPEADLPAF